MASRAQVSRKLKSQIDKLNKHADALEARAKKMRAAVKKARSRLKRLQGASAGAWQDVARGAQGALSSIRNALGSAKRRFSK